MTGIAAAARDHRRPLQFWNVFNAWWRDLLDRSGVRPSQEDISVWFEANATQAWPDSTTAPSLRELRTHAKCLRSTQQVRDYFRRYRATRRAKRTSTQGSQPVSEDDDDDDPSETAGASLLSAPPSVSAGCSRGDTVASTGNPTPASNLARPSSGVSQSVSGRFSVPAQLQRQHAMSMMLNQEGSSPPPSQQHQHGTAGPAAATAPPSVQQQSHCGPTSRSGPPCASSGGPSTRPPKAGKTPYAKYTALLSSAAGQRQQQLNSELVAPVTNAVGMEAPASMQGTATQACSQAILQRTGSASARLQTTPTKEAPPLDPPPAKRMALRNTYSGPVPEGMVQQITTDGPRWSTGNADGTAHQSAFILEAVGNIDANTDKLATRANAMPGPQLPQQATASVGPAGWAVMQPGMALPAFMGVPHPLAVPPSRSGAAPAQTQHQAAASQQCHQAGLQQCLRLPPQSTVDMPSSLPRGGLVPMALPMQQASRAHTNQHLAEAGLPPCTDAAAQLGTPHVLGDMDMDAIFDMHDDWMADDDDAGLIAMVTDGALQTQAAGRAPAAKSELPPSASAMPQRGPEQPVRNASMLLPGMPFPGVNGYEPQGGVYPGPPYLSAPYPYPHHLPYGYPPPPPPGAMYGPDGPWGYYGMPPPPRHLHPYGPGSMPPPHHVAPPPMAAQPSPSKGPAPYMVASAQLPQATVPAKRPASQPQQTPVQQQLQPPVVPPTQLQSQQQKPSQRSGGAASAGGPPEASSCQVKAAARMRKSSSGVGPDPCALMSQEQQLELPALAAEPLMPGRYVWQATRSCEPDAAGHGAGECGRAANSSPAEASYCSYGRANNSNNSADCAAASMREAGSCEEVSCAEGGGDSGMQRLTPGHHMPNALLSPSHMPAAGSAQASPQQQCFQLPLAAPPCSHKAVAAPPTAALVAARVCSPSPHTGGHMQHATSCSMDASASMADGPVHGAIMGSGQGAHLGHHDVQGCLPGSELADIMMLCCSSVAAAPAWRHAGPVAADATPRHRETGPSTANAYGATASCHSMEDNAAAVGPGKCWAEGADGHESMDPLDMLIGLGEADMMAMVRVTSAPPGMVHGPMGCVAADGSAFGGAAAGRKSDSLEHKQLGGGSESMHWSMYG